MPRYGKGSDLARELGITRQAVSKAEQVGRISRNKDGLFDLDAAKIQYRLHTDPAQQRRALAQQGQGATAALDEPLTLSDYRIRRERADAERAELEVAQLKGRLGDVESIASAGRRAAYAIVGSLTQLPDRVAAECGTDDAMRSKIRQVLAREIDRLRQETAEAVVVPPQ